MSSHAFPQELLRQIDVIEGYNSRTMRGNNQQAVDLALKLNKPICAGSDAHFYQELGRATTLFPPTRITEENARQTLLKGEIHTEIMNCNYLHAVPLIILSGLYGRLRRARVF